MRRKNVMSKVRKKLKREGKEYYEYINYLYDLFFNCENITENEISIFKFILKLPISEVKKMLESIFINLKELELEDSLFHKIIFKFSVMFYIQNNKAELEKTFDIYVYE